MGDAARGHQDRLTTALCDLSAQKRFPGRHHLDALLQPPWVPEVPVSRPGKGPLPRHGSLPWLRGQDRNNPSQGEARAPRPRRTEGGQPQDNSGAHLRVRAQVHSFAHARVRSALTSRASIMGLALESLSPRFPSLPGVGFRRAGLAGAMGRACYPQGASH